MRAWRMAFHQEPELSLYEEHTRDKVVSALKELHIPYRTYDTTAGVVGLIGADRPGPGRRPPSRHGRASHHRADRVALRVEVSGADARVRPRRSHGQPARRRGDDGAEPASARGTGEALLPSRRGGRRARRGPPSDRAGMPRGPEGRLRGGTACRTGAAAGERRMESGLVHGRGRPFSNGGPRPRRSRVDPPPGSGCDRRRERDRDRAPNAGRPDPRPDRPHRRRASARSTEGPATTSCRTRSSSRARSEP